MKLRTLVTRWIHRGALASTSLTVLLGAGSAVAQVSPAPAPICPLPTLEVCQGDNYLTSPCGQQHSSRCNELIQQEYEQRWAALTEEHTTLLPDSFGGKLGTSRPAPYSALGSTSVENGGGAYAGAVLKNQVLYRKNFQNLTASDIAARDALQQWNTNGTTIRSCKEYVFEKYYEFSQFENQMGAHGTKYRRIFEDAYGPNGIAYKSLHGKAGGLLAPIFNGQAAPKNLYFKAFQGPYPSGTTGHQINPTLLQQVPASGRTYYQVTWAWHDEMSDALASRNDAQLDRLFGKQLEFAELVERRQELWNTYNRQAPKLTGIPLEQLRQRVTQQLIGLDQAIEAGLEQAQADGCLGLAGDTGCDWSPRRFKEMIEDEMLRRREADYQLCQTLTGDDFTASSFPRNAGALGIPGMTGDQTGTAAALGQYLNTYRSALLSEPRLVVAATQETRRSDSRSSSDSFGNSNFRADYAYGAGWEFNTTSMLNTCTDFDARVYAYFEANARAFSINREIIYASAEGTATKNEVGYSVLLRVLGADVYNVSNTYPTSFSVGPDPDVSRTFFSASGRFLVLGVPIRVSAGVSGTVGIDTQLSGQFISGCKFNLSSELTPYARLDAYASVAVDVVVAAVGVRGDLELVSVELPFTTTMDVYLDSSGGSTRLMLDLDTLLKSKVSSMDGRLVVFLRILWKTGEEELASFNGTSHTATLLDESRTIPLSSFF